MNILSKSTFASREFFISKSWNGSSRHLKPFWPRTPLNRAERADWPFSIVAVWGPSKRAKPSAWDPPPGSLIRAYSGQSLPLGGPIGSRRLPKGRGSATRLISLKRDRGGQKSRGHGFSSDPRGYHLNVQIFPGKGLGKYEGRVYPSRTCLPSAGLRSESLTPTSLILRRSFSNSRNRWWTYSRTTSWSST